MKNIFVYCGLCLSWARKGPRYLPKKMASLSKKVFGTDRDHCNHRTMTWTDLWMSPCEIEQGL